MQNLVEHFRGEMRPLELLSKHTYYKIGGPCEAMVFPTTLEDLASLENSGVSGVLGLGSNVLVADRGIAGVILKTSKLNLETSLQGDRLRTGAGLGLFPLLRRASEHGWGGLEFLAGIPGTVGGAVAMNAGTHLGEVKDRLLEVEYFHNGNLHTCSQFAFEYRRNLFLPKGAILWSASWRIEPTDPASVRQKIQEISDRRQLTQPVDLPSCGSVFKNPLASGLKAWQVIEQLGLRGKRVGGAQFSPKHANFIVNLGQAKASDVRELIELAQHRAREVMGVSLEPEVQFLGFEETT